MNESQHSLVTLELPLSGKEGALEINHRKDSDNEVIEFWVPGEDKIEVDVIPQDIDTIPFSFEVDPSKAQDAFEHPYAYAAHLMIAEAFSVAA